MECRWCVASTLQIQSVGAGTYLPRILHSVRNFYANCTLPSLAVVSAVAQAVK